MGEPFMLGVNGVTTMSDRPIVIVDPHFRRMDEVFSPEDRKRLYGTVEVVWGKDDPMPFDPDHPIRKAEGVILSAHRAGSVREGLWEIGQMTVDDLEAIVLGVPPRRLQSAQPELALRYATGGVAAHNED